MNINLQLCGLVITILMLILYLSHKRLRLIGERVFLYTIILAIVCIFFDALSVVAIFYNDELPVLLTELCCKLYLGSMIWVGWVNIVYVSMDLTTTKAYHKQMTGILAKITVFEYIIILLLPIGIYNVGQQIYTYGPAVVTTYVFTLLDIVSTTIIAIYIIYKGNSRRGLAVILATSLWIIAAVIQSLNNEMLLVGFSMSVGIMILYIVMENPDASLDRTLGCFNSYALNNYLSSKLENSEKFSILDISITNVKALEDKRINIVEEAKKIINAIKSENDVYLFKNYSTELMVVSSDYDKLDKLCQLVNQMIMSYEGIGNSISLFLLKDAQSFGNINEITKFLTYIRNTSINLETIVYISDEMINKYHEFKKIEKEIDAALEEDRVEVFYQPIYSIETNKAIAAESLARIRNKDGSIMLPSIFITVAETTGQIMKIGDRILEKVCQFIHDSDVINLGIETIHVNLSAVQCDDDNAANNLRKIVEKYGINPNNISFEITETAVSSSKDILIKNMNTLTSHDFKFVLDDFGKGESNLMYIVEMPIDTIKFDMDMSKAYFNNNKAKIVVSAVSKMAHQLDLPIVAEGVESKEEIESLAKEGVDYIQGFYYSKPLPANEFLNYLKNAN